MIWYGVACISKLLEIIGLFCKRALHKRSYSAKETYNFKEPTNHSHPVWLHLTAYYLLQNGDCREFVDAVVRFVLKYVDSNGEMERNDDLIELTHGELWIRHEYVTSRI